MAVSLLLIHFFFLPAMIGRQVIIEQVNHTSFCSREREKRERGVEKRGLGGEGDFLFLLELLLNNCTAVCISVRAACQDAYKISCAEKRPA